MSDNIQVVYKNKLKLEALSSVLKRVAIANEKNLMKYLLKNDKKTTIVTDHYPQFNITGGKAGISLYEYMLRLNDYMCCSKETFIIAMIYLNRFQGVGKGKNKQKTIVLTRNNIHKAFLTALVLAIKYQDDDHATNEYYAKIGGMSMKKFNALESTMLMALEFNLNFTETEYNQYYNTVDMKYEVLANKALHQIQKESDENSVVNVQNENNNENKQQSTYSTLTKLRSSKSIPNLRSKSDQSSIFRRILASVAA